jgi:putative ATPase
MQCLPDNLKDRRYYRPTGEGVEKQIRERMEEIRKNRIAAKENDSPRRHPSASLRPGSGTETNEV